MLPVSGCSDLNLKEYPISMGIANTKALSKVATKVAKKFPDKTHGVYLIGTDEKRIKALKWLPIEDVWGIGRRHAKRLMALGITNAYAFTQLPDQWVRKNMSVVGLRLKGELEGKPMLDMETAKPKQNIATTRSFEKQYTDFEELRERISTFEVTCAEKLRNQKSCYNALLIFPHTNWFRSDLPQYSRNIVIHLPFPTNSSIEIARFAKEGLAHIFKAGCQYKKAGVIVKGKTRVPYNLPDVTLTQYAGLNIVCVIMTHGRFCSFTETNSGFAR